MSLAGVGSRILAAIVDTVIQYISLLALLGVAVGLGGSSAITIAIVASLSVASFFAYHIAFEVRNAGRTPGKAVIGLRVVDSSGGPVRLGASFARNLMRVIDLLPGIYLIGLLTVLASARSQRLGDMVAGTLVIHERHVPTRRTPQAQPLQSYLPAGSLPSAEGLSAEEMSLVHDFLDRRGTLAWQHRTRLARQLQDQLTAKTGVPVDPSTDPEAFLQALVAPPGAAKAVGIWDVSAVTAQDVAVLEGFLERRFSLEWGPRVTLARKLMDGLVTKVSAPGDLTRFSPEDFLERLYQLKTSSRP